LLIAKFSKTISPIVVLKGGKKYIMKKYRFVILVIASVIVVVIGVAFACYITFNKDRLIYEYMLYDHIEYNGNEYYMIDTNKYPSGEALSSEERGLVYLIYKSSKINYKKCNTAYVLTGYEGEEEEIYLFFDSARWIRGDYRTISKENE